MIPKRERPVPGRDDGPSLVVSRAAEHRENRTRPTRVQWLTFRLSTGGDCITVRGREAQTLELLLKVGEAGFTSGEASPLGWARRTSHYVRQLRLQGVPIATASERTCDATVGRYRLSGPVYVEARGMDRPAAGG